MRAAGAAATGILGLLGAAGATSSNDEARVAAIGAIAVAVVTGLSTIIGQVISARNNRRPSDTEEMRDLALLVLLDSHTDDPESKAEAEELARHMRSHMKALRRERVLGAAEEARAVAPPRPPRGRRRPLRRRAEGDSGDGPDEQ